MDKKEYRQMLMDRFYEEYPWVKILPKETRDYVRSCAQAAVNTVSPDFEFAQDAYDAHFAYVKELMYNAYGEDEWKP